MKRFILMAAIAVMTAMSFSSCERVDAGHEGILVNLYGSDKGVNDVSLVTGMVWYNPLTQNMYEYPTFMSFDHWTNAVAAYKKFIQKYDPPPKDYYKYLQDLGYAEDPNYIIKLKQIVSKK